MDLCDYWQSSENYSTPGAAVERPQLASLQAVELVETKESGSWLQLVERDYSVHLIHCTNYPFEGWH